MAGEPEGDIFDPEVIVAAENKAFETTGSPDEDAIRKYLDVRRHHYVNVFSVGETRKESLDFVLADLAVWSKAYGPTWDRDQKVQDLREGRRELYMRIMEITGIPHDWQFVKYMDTVINNQQRLS